MHKRPGPARFRPIQCPGPLGLRHCRAGLFVQHKATVGRCMTTCMCRPDVGSTAAHGCCLCFDPENRDRSLMTAVDRLSAEQHGTRLSHNHHHDTLCIVCSSHLEPPPRAAHTTCVPVLVVAAPHCDDPDSHQLKHGTRPWTEATGIQVQVGLTQHP